MVDQPGFFDLSDRLRELSAKGDDLERIAALVDFAQFRPELERAVPRSDGSKGGRPAFDRVLMFKVLLLQAMHGLSDERAEYLIKDRLSFMRFLGLGLADPVTGRQHDLDLPRVTQACRRGGAAVRSVRRHAACCRLPGDGRSDRGRDHRGGTQAAQHRGRAGCDQGRADPRGLGREARQAASEGPRCALDSEVLQGQAT